MPSFYANLGKSPDLLGLLAPRNRLRINENFDRTAAMLSCCQIYSGLSTVLRVRRSAVTSRYGQPEEFAELLGFMVSPAAKWMTGTLVRMDGGETKGI